MWPSEFPRPVYTVYAKIAAVEIYGVLILGTHVSESMLLALCLYSEGAGIYLI